MGEFVFGLLVGAILGVALCLITEVQEAKYTEKQTIKTDKKPKTHYLLNDPMYPITLHQLRTFAYQQKVNTEELVKILDENGYVIQWVKRKYVPCFTYLVVEQTIFREFDKEGYVKVKVMTKKYRDEQR